MGKSVTGFQATCRYLAGILVIAPLMTGAVTSTVTVQVTVLEPPCVINDDRPIEVDFGEVMTTRVDGVNYRRPVDYTLLCSKAFSNAIKLQVQGNGASFDRTVLHTNKAGLGIGLRHGDNKLPVNNWLNFTYPNAPALWAVPVRQSGATLKGGEFTASATLQVAYQ